jgi:site-specific DNA recombinase
MNLVRKELELKGIKTRAGKNWAKSTIHQMLANPIYAGKIQENGQLYDGMHEPIIAPDDFF